MSRKVPFECTISTGKDSLHVTAIGSICQQDKLCDKTTKGIEAKTVAEILASLQGTKVYPHSVERDEKGNVRRIIPKKREVVEPEK